jgi:hypothetical protein
MGMDGGIGGGFVGSLFHCPFLVNVKRKVKKAEADP